MKIIKVYHPTWCGRNWSPIREEIQGIIIPFPIVTINNPKNTPYIKVEYNKLKAEKTVITKSANVNVQTEILMVRNLPQYSSAINPPTRLKT